MITFAKPSRNRHRTWIRRIGFVTSTQTALQVLSATSGLLIVRGLSVPGYAQYTLCISVLSAISVLSESGFNSAIMTLGGPVFQDGGRLRAILDRALAARRRLASAVAAVAVPGLFVLLLQVDTSPVEAGLIAMLVLATIPGAVYMGPLHTLLRLRNDYRRLQVASLAASVVRLSLLVPVLAASLGTLPAMVVNTGSMYVEAALLRRALRHHLDPVGVVGDQDVAVMRRSVRRMLPIHVFYVAQGQIIVTLLGALGVTRTLASIAALQRFNVLFGLTSTILSSVMVPAFARLDRSQPLLLRWYVRLVAASCAVVGLTLLAITLGAGPLLSLLGKDYRGLTGPLIIVSAAAAVLTVGSLIAHLNQARGWLALAWLTIPVTILSVVFGAIAFDITTVHGAAWFSMAIAVGPSLANVASTVAGLRFERGFHCDTEISHGQGQARR